MNVTIISDVQGVGDNGTFNTVKQLSTAMLKMGHKVTIVSPCEAPENDKSGIKYVTTRQRFTWGLGWLLRKNGVIIAKPQKQKIIQGIKDADIVYLVLPFKLSKKAIKILQARRIPYVAGCHYQAENFASQLGMTHFKPLLKLVYGYYWNGFFKKTEYLHCNSHFTEETYRKFGFKDKHYMVASTGYNDKIIKMDAPKPEEYKDKFVIINSGRYVNEKRQDVLIRAVAKSKYKDKIQLICTGQGPKGKSYARLAKKLNINVKFEYLSLDDYVRTLNTGDLYVHASEVELLGLSCIEAMACGLPCVFANSESSASKDFAIDEHCLFTPGDDVDLAEKIDYFIENSDKLKEYGDKYFEISKEHTNEKFMTNINKIFEEAIEYYKKYYAEKDEQEINSDPSMFLGAGAHDHVVKVKRKKKRKLVDANYKFEHNNFLYKIYSFFWCVIAKVFLPIGLKYEYHYKIIGKEKIRALKGKGAVLISNHCHVMDVPLLVSRLSTFRKIRFLTTSNNLAIPIAGHIIVAFGAYPTADDIGGAKNLKRSINKILQDKKLLLVCPEGSINPYGTNIREFHSGAFKFVIDNDVPMLPIIITFKEHLRKHNKTPKYKIIVNICDPIEPNKELKTAKEQVEDLMQRTHSFMTQYVDDFYRTNPVTTLKTFDREPSLQSLENKEKPE